MCKIQHGQVMVATKEGANMFGCSEGEEFYAVNPMRIPAGLKPTSETIPCLRTWLENSKGGDEIILCEDDINKVIPLKVQDYVFARECDVVAKFDKLLDPVVFGDVE